MSKKSLVKEVIMCLEAVEPQLTTNNIIDVSVRVLDNYTVIIKTVDARMCIGVVEVDMSYLNGIETKRRLSLIFERILGILANEDIDSQLKELKEVDNLKTLSEGN